MCVCGACLDVCSQAADLDVESLTQHKFEHLLFSDYTLPREQVPTHIDEAIRWAAERLKKCEFQTHAPAADAGEAKLLVRRGHIEVKIAVNFVMHGTVRPVRHASLTLAAREQRISCSPFRRAMPKA